VTERINGEAAFTRRTHGSSRRGVFPVPATSISSRQEQSRGDKARLIELMKQRNAERIVTLESDLGNKELPAYKHKQEILANIESYKAIILGGATGSGKSTQLPQYLYEAGYDMTVMLVPRRVIADGLGERIREELTEQINNFDPLETVGIVHGERTERHENNKILVMTPNTFIKMEQDLRVNFGEKKLAIVADEIHEANLFTEIATGAAAMSVREHENWRLIAASATHNADTLQKPFQKLNDNPYVPEIMIEGRPFNIEMQEEPTKNPMEVYASVGDIHEKTMIFTSGKREIDHIIEETIYALDKNQPGSSANVVFRKLHGELSEYELGHIDDPIPADSRLVIVSSPAGMSGITIPGVTLVISDGTINRQELDEDGVPGLKRDNLSKSEVIQQAGRAGRDVPGGIAIIAKPTAIIDDILRQRGEPVEVSQMEFIEFSQREQHAPPEIYSTNLSRVVLSTARLGYRFSEINDYIPHPVKSSEIIKAEEALSRLGALNDEDRITPIGKFMDDFPISPELSRGLFEVRKRAGTLQQLARASFIAAALNEGGLQDFTEKDKIEWKKLLRTSTSNDYIAQLDIMTALEQATTAEKPLFEFIDTYDLSPKRVERAQKGARKMLHLFNINIENIVVTAPTVSEEKELLDDFTAGLIDQIYQEAGSAYRKKLYRNIHGNAESKRRTLSDRSVTIAKSGELIGGTARWYEKWNKRDKVSQRYDIVELTIPVDPEVVGRYALESKLLYGKPVNPRLEGERVVEREQGMFGSIPVGEPAPARYRESISPEAQQLLVERVLQAPGETQLALREIADELALYRQRTPEAVYAQLRKSDAPKDITKPFIKELIEKYAKTTRDGREIELRLRHYLYSQNVGIDRYFSDEALVELKEHSPDSISIGNEDTRLFYDNAQPYVTGLHHRQLTHVTGPMYLPDGREVLKQVPLHGGGVERVSIHL
jgi:HrpA-like RNA helicase